MTKGIERVRGVVDDQGRTLLTARIPRGLRKRLKMMAIEQDRTLGAVVAEALAESLARVKRVVSGKKRGKVVVLRRVVRRP